MQQEPQIINEPNRNSCGNEKEEVAQIPRSANPDWTAGRLAALIVLAIVCAVLVWNAYTPIDIFFTDLKYEVLAGDRFDPRSDATVEGNPLRIYHTFYPKGLGVHANSEVFLRFIPDGYSFFTAEIGVDHEAGEESSASVIFTVLSDGTLLYESPIMKSGMPPRQIYVHVKNRKTLTLKVTDAGDGNDSDHADWAMARFLAR